TFSTVGMGCPWETNKRPRAPANIYEGVVDRVPKRTNVFLRRPGCGSDYRRFDQSDPKGRKNQNNYYEERQRHGAPNWREPGGSERSQQKILAAQDQIGQRKRSAKP